MKNLILFKICSFILIFLICRITFCQENLDLNIIDDSNKEVQFWLDKIPFGMERDYGFKSREDFKAIKLLKPINVIYPSEDYFRNDLIDTSRIRLTRSIYWKIPITVNDNFCCFLQGEEIDGVLKITRIGGNILAQELNNASMKLSRLNYKNNDMLVFPDIKKHFWIYYNDSLNSIRTKCIALEKVTGNNLLSEQNIFEAFNNSKKYSIQKK